MSKKAQKPNGPSAQADEDILIFVDSVANEVADLPKLIQFHLARLMKDGQTAARLAHVYSAVRQTNDAIAEMLKPLSEAQEILGKTMVPEAFNRENVKSFTTGDGYRVTLSHKYYASIRADQRAAAYDWLRANELSALLIETVNSSTLSAAGKAMLEQGKELPEDLFNAYFQDGVSLTKVK